MCTLNVYLHCMLYYKYVLNIYICKSNWGCLNTYNSNSNKNVYFWIFQFVFELDWDSVFKILTSKFVDYTIYFIEISITFLVNLFKNSSFLNKERICVLTMMFKLFTTLKMDCHVSSTRARKNISCCIIRCKLTHFL